MSDAMKQMQFDGLVEFITEHNKIVTEVNAVTGNKDELAENIRESPEFEDLRNQIAALEEQLDAAVEVRVKEALEGATADTNVEELTTKAKDLKSTIQAGISYFKKLYGDEAAEGFPKVERIKGQRSGGGSGGKRIRGYNWIITMGDDVKEFENAATAAKYLGLETKALQEHFFAKAGVEQIKDAPDEVNMHLEWENTDEDGTTSVGSADIKAYRTEPTGSKDAEAEAEAEPEFVDEDELAEL